MIASSRFIRPLKPSTGLIPQTRDRLLLECVRACRFMRSDHLRQLFFAEVSMRSAQRRLRQLWEHRYLERSFISVASGSPALVSARPGQPIYHLGRLGQAYLATQSSSVDGAERQRRPRRVGFMALDHHLLTTDFLVSLSLTLKEKEDIALSEVLTEARLWRRLRQWKKQHPNKKTLVPDGGFTLCYPHIVYPCSFFIEIVRSGVKGGNRCLFEKLKKYVRLHHEGFFQQAYGVDNLRAVIVATSSWRRAEHFRALARKLPYGRGLFWFGVYNDAVSYGDGDERAGRGVKNTLTPPLILTHRWQDVAGRWRGLNDVNRLRQEPDDIV